MWQGEKRPRSGDQEYIQARGCPAELVSATMTDRSRSPDLGVSYLGHVVYYKYTM